MLRAESYFLRDCGMRWGSIQDDKIFAHSLENRPEEEWQGLDEHLKGTAELAASFAAEFGCGEWGYLAGLWHDIKKFLAHY